MKCFEKTHQFSSACLGSFLWRPLAQKLLVEWIFVSSIHCHLMCVEITDCIEMEHTPVTPRQTSVCSPVMDTRRSLGAAAYFFRQTSSQTQCPLAHRTLWEKKPKLVDYFKLFQWACEKQRWEICFRRYSLGTVWVRMSSIFSLGAHLRSSTNL